MSCNSILTPEVLDIIARSVAEAPEFSPEQRRALRAIWAPKPNARRMQPAGEVTPKGS